MGKRKHRKRKKFARPENVITIPVKQEKEPKSQIISKSAEFPLTDEDKVIYVYEINAAQKVSEVVNVSYQALMVGSWVTLLRFDSEHGFLHGHRRISLRNEQEVVFTAGVKRKGTPHHWLTWAIEYLIKNHLDYKKSFLKRSETFDKAQ